MQNTKTGTVTGTGAALNISVGFIPDNVRIFNGTDGSSIEWFSSMANGAGFKTVAAGTRSVISTGGITPFAGSATAGQGFSIGTDAQLNINGQVIRYIAMGNTPGNA